MIRLLGDRVALAVMAVAVTATISLSIFGYPVIGHDAWLHLNWLRQFGDQFAAGDLYPRWMERSNGGLGSPAFYFYPPFAYFLSGLIVSIARLPAETIYHILQLFAVVASTATFYVYARRRALSPNAVALASLVYGFGPYRLLNGYVRSALSEQIALAILPLVMLAVERVCEEDARYLPLLVLTASLLALTNVPVAVIAAYMAAAIAITKGLSTKSVILLFSAGILVIGLSAFYWLPAFALTTLVQLKQLWLLTTRERYSVFGLFGSVIGLHIVALISTLALIATLIHLHRKGGAVHREWRRFATVIGILAIVLQIPILSAPIWRWAPGLELTQFAWRWQVAGMPIICMCIAHTSRERVRAGLAIVFGLLVLAYIPVLFRPTTLATPPQVDSSRPDASEYNTMWVTADPFAFKREAKQWQQRGAASIEEQHSYTDTVFSVKKLGSVERFQVSLASQRRVTFHRLYWPYWRLTQDQTLIRIGPDSNGVLTAELPAGNYEVELRLSEPSEIMFGQTLSAVSILVLLISSVLIWKKRIPTDA